MEAAVRTTADCTGIQCHLLHQSSHKKKHATGHRHQHRCAIAGSAARIHTTFTGHSLSCLVMFCEQPRTVLLELLSAVSNRESDQAVEDFIG